jgi:hypothetical protein
VPAVGALVGNPVVPEDFKDGAAAGPHFTKVGSQKSVYLRFIVPVVISTIPADFLDSVGEVGAGI